MATPSKIQLSPNHHPEFYTSGMNDEGAKKASELLQENHDKHHIFFRASGFHNHIAHHMLTLYAIGANPSTMQRQYDANLSYQRPVVSPENRSVTDMHDTAKFKQCLGKQEHYHDYLLFFQEEMEKKGWESVVNESLFSRTEQADDLLVRTFGGFLHPLIHLGFGIEFAQPAIIAEALAQAAVHTNWMGPFLHSAEDTAAKLKKSNKKSKTLVQLLDEIRADTVLSTAAQWSDDNKVRDGIIGRAGDAMIDYTSQYFITEGDDLEEKVAEMTNAVIWYTGGAQRPPKLVKFDFYFMHCVNSSIFFPAFINADWLSTANKIRLLEWKGRGDLAMYASRRSPVIQGEEIENYIPKISSKESEDAWGGVFERVRDMEDDGHAAKLIRALAHGKKVSGKFEGRDGFKVKGPMWDNLGHMAIDSVEAPGNHWVRSAGFDEAWVDFEERQKAVL